MLSLLPLTFGMGGLSFGLLRAGVLSRDPLFQLWYLALGGGQAQLERGAPRENVFVVLLPDDWSGELEGVTKNESYRQALARRYDAIYQHAFTNRKKSPAPPTNGSLIPIEA